jgi:hypothetical protein
MWKSSEFRAGEWVQVRSKEEILATLDREGKLDGLSFMPEMFEQCGKRLRVFRRAHKTCDPPNGLSGRRMLGAVHLEDVRCGGAAHGGCQAACLVFWKDAWLTRADQPGAPHRAVGNRPPAVCSEHAVTAGCHAAGASADSDDPVYVCQSTQMQEATTPLRWWDVRQYVEDWTSGNVALVSIAAALLHTAVDWIANAGIGVGAAARWAYDLVQRLRGGVPYPARNGTIPVGQKTPSVRLDVQPGEFVRVRRYEEILATLNEISHNRGMVWDPEMVPFCGETHRVLRRVDRIIDEKTGRMLKLKNDCIQLDGVVCRACYAKYRRFCPRSIFPYWREIWLERVGGTAPAGR